MDDEWLIVEWGDPCCEPGFSILETQNWSQFEASRTLGAFRENAIAFGSAVPLALVA
jgi:hypothetical protein